MKEKNILNHNLLEKLILVGLCLSGTAALIYEVAWTRALSLVMGSTTYALSTMLAAFMAGLTLGGYLGGRWADRTKNPALSFAIVEGSIAVFGLITFIIIKNLSPIYAWVFNTFHLSFSSFSIAQFIMAFLIMIIPTTLMGATFPLVLKARAHRLDTIGKEAGNVYSINNLGAIAGSLMAGFVLIPLVGVKLTNLFAAGVNLITAVTIIYFVSRLDYKKTIGVLLIFLIPATLFSVYIVRSGDFGLFYSFYKAKNNPLYESFSKSVFKHALLFEEEGLNGLVQVFRDPYMKRVYLVTNGKVEGSAIRDSGEIVDSPTGTIDWANQLLLAYLPLEANRGAKSFLSIGLGTGTTTRAIMSDRGLKEIDVVEINPLVVKAVNEHFYPELFIDERINFIEGDARNYLSLSSKHYDAIASEPSYPVDQGISALFSLEFFRLVRARLTDEGVFAQWIPSYLLNKDEFKMMLRTFNRVFPETYVWYMSASKDIILLGSKGPIDLDGIEGRIAMREKAAGMAGKYELYLDPEKVREITAKPGPLNTDDRPVLEFIAARNML